MPEETMTMTTGRRKEAVAKVKLIPGTGQILVNGRALQDYFPRQHLQTFVQEPLKATQTSSKFDCVAQVAGGGLAGQAGAVRQGLSRALVVADQTLKSVLRKGGFLTRDPRVRERKKYGQKGARKRFQWTKR
ncbi:MAG: 30S ribosomal protein S9 [Candidatus Omnitrophica bacterium]|nr:30S ribosomal protein S9 [Candidatus Omnitrophota bacterium]